jgi:hypothetical protein
MRENLSLLSFWGLVLSLIAVTLFVVVYWYKTSTDNVDSKDIVGDLRRRSVDIYLVAETPEAEGDSKKLRGAADEIARLRAKSSVLFWLIIAMNMVVIGLFTIAYRTF